MLSGRRKLYILPVLIYWPVLIVLTSIPVPRMVRRMGVSDKTLHFLAYMILLFLLWFAVNPARKANWRKCTIWCVFFITVLFGAINEWLQSYVGRSADIMDFTANAAGAAAGLVLVSLVTSWPAWLILTAISIFLLENVTRVKLHTIAPHTDTVFHLLSYASFSVFWIFNINHLWRMKIAGFKWLITALALPVGFLITVNLYSALFGRGIVLSQLILSAVSIAAVVGIVFVTSLLRRKMCESPRSENNTLL